MIRKTVTTLSIVALATATAALPVAAASPADSGIVQIAACNPCAAKGCNPCAAKNPCNPCAAKK